MIYDYYDNSLKRFLHFGDHYSKKFRFNEKINHYCVFGLSNGWLKFYDMKKVKSKKLKFDNLGGVQDMQWDPNSANYLIVC
jgi:hypothetical protein